MLKIEKIEKTWKEVNYYLKVINYFQTIDIIYITEEFLQQQNGDKNIVFCQWIASGKILYSELTPKEINLVWQCPKRKIQQGLINKTIEVSKQRPPDPEPLNFRQGQVYKPLVIPPVE